MSAFTLETAGLDFKRIPLPEHAIIHPTENVQPQIIKGSLKSLVHLTNQDTFKSEFDHSLGFYYDAYIKTQKNSQYQMVLDQSNHEPIWLKFTQNEIIENNKIVLEPFCKSTVILSYEGDSRHHGHTEIIIKEGAELTLVKIQNNHLSSQFVDETLIEVHDRGSIKVIDLQLGSENMIVNYEANLVGYQSHCDFKSIYLASGKRGIDLSFTANHEGKQSTSHILGKGVLSDHAKKVFRGTLNFREGSAQSVGKEEEVVLLLSDTVKSDSIPALMCSEDDVIGEHGASIGQVDEEQLFYLMSRGLSETQAKLLIISSSFKEVLDLIPEEEARQYANELVERSIVHVV